MNKTIQKLKSICQLHGVTMDIVSYGPHNDWEIVFDAPPKMCWVSGTSTAVVYHGDSLRGVVSYLRNELKFGFFDADQETLQQTGQA
jgi:hypothetical protein